MEADMPDDFMKLTVKIVVHKNGLSSNKYLHKFFLIYYNQDRYYKIFMEYINIEVNFDGDHLTEITLNSKFQFYDEDLDINK